eukprot:scaffold10856_cov100-Isochrysis_galbana.AAC.6
MRAGFEKSKRKAHSPKWRQRGTAGLCVYTCPCRWLFSFLYPFADCASFPFVFDDDGNDLDVRDWLVDLVSHLTFSMPSMPCTSSSPLPPPTNHSASARVSFVSRVRVHGGGECCELCASRAEYRAPYVSA